MSKGVLGHVNMGTGTFKPFNQTFASGLHVSPSDILDGKCDGLVIWGGADISPSIYGEPVSPRTGADAALSYRDKIEVAAAEAAIKVGIPLIGVCRGAQLLCAMAGGKLIQDVQHHAGPDHEITTHDGRTYVTSSLHHQMMYPFLLDADKWDMVAWSKEARSRSYHSDLPRSSINVDLMRNKVDGSIIEPEIVYFHNINALCIQGHPEFMDADDAFVKYCNELVEEYL